MLLAAAQDGQIGVCNVQVQSAFDSQYHVMRVYAPVLCGSWYSRRQTFCQLCSCDGDGIGVCHWNTFRLVLGWVGRHAILQLALGFGSAFCGTSHTSAGESV